MKVRKPILGTLLASVLFFEACTIPAWVNTVESDAAVAAPIAASLIDVIDPALAPVVTLIGNGFSALVKTVGAYKASPTATNLQAVQSAFEAVDANVAQLESAAQIKNPATQTTVTAVVQLLTQAVTEIAALVPPAAATAEPGAPLRVHGQAKGWKAQDFKQKFNAIIQGDPRFAGKEIK
jgi:hypothetical protein